MKVPLGRPKCNEAVLIREACPLQEKPIFLATGTVVVPPLEKTKVDVAGTRGRMVSVVGVASFSVHVQDDLKAPGESPKYL